MMLNSYSVFCACDLIASSTIVHRNGAPSATELMLLIIISTNIVPFVVAPSCVVLDNEIDNNLYF